MRAKLVALAVLLGTMAGAWAVYNPTLPDIAHPTAEVQTQHLAHDSLRAAIPVATESSPQRSLREEAPAEPIVANTTPELHISALPPKGLEAIRLLNIALVNNNLPPIPADAKIQESDIETFISSFFAVHEDYIRCRAAYFDAVHDLANKQGAKIQEAIRSGREPNAEEGSVATQNAPNEHVSIMHPAMSSKTYVIRVPATSVMNEWNAFASSKLGFVTFCDRTLRPMFSN